MHCAVRFAVPITSRLGHRGRPAEQRPPPCVAPHSRSTNSCKRWALPMVPYIQHILALLGAELAVDAWRSVMSANQHELMLLSLQELVPCCRGCRCRCHRCLGLAPARRLPRGARPRWDSTLQAVPGVALVLACAVFRAFWHDVVVGRVVTEAVVRVAESILTPAAHSYKLHAVTPEYCHSG